MPRQPSDVANMCAPSCCAQVLTDLPSAAALASKLAPPLVTLLGSNSEMQYVALRNIGLIVQKYPAVLARDVKAGRDQPCVRCHHVPGARIKQTKLQVFFCKYNDPIFVKMEKVSIMTQLASEQNIDQVWELSLDGLWGHQ